jgi:hypothetical protein
MREHKNRRESALKTLTKLAAIILFAVTANAQGTKPATKKTQPATAAAPAKKESFKESLNNDKGYGLAGCGIGSMVFGAKPGFIQVVAATLNGTAASQTFGITTGTSNCDIPKMGQSAAVYIEANKEIVMKDASRGEGETMSDLALIYNCSNTQLFSEKVQNNYSQIFDSSNAYDSSRAILNTIKSDSALSASCNIAG